MDNRPAAQRRFRFRRAALHGAVGFVLGYVVLHPVAMVVFGWFEGERGDVGGLIVHHLADSFTAGMLPMGLVFGVFSLLVGAVDGFYRSVVRYQRDGLARQLEVNRAQRRQLERQNASLRELERDKRRTTQFLVHDLKNHVGCVLGYARLLAQRARSGDWEERDVRALDAVERQALRMNGAVRDILGLAKLEARPRIDVRPVRVSELLSGGLASSALGPGEGRVAVPEVVTAGLSAMCDRSLIERVIANLVLNAVRHNGPEVEVALTAASGGGGEVVLSCADTGHGIPAEIRERIFDEYESGPGERGSTSSHGLGLAFCRAAVAAHGGRIWCDSEEGRGTTFNVELPRAVEREMET